MRPLRTRDLKALAEEELDNYDDEMIEDLTNQLIEYLDGISIEEVDATEVYEMVEKWFIDLPEPGTWAFDQVQSKIDSYNDMKYDEARDEAMMGDRL